MCFPEIGVMLTAFWNAQRMVALATALANERFALAKSKERHLSLKIDIRHGFLSRPLTVFVTRTRRALRCSKAFAFAC